MGEKFRLVASASLTRRVYSHRPHPIHVDVDSEDLDGRADHLENPFAALHVYLVAIIADTTQNVPTGTLDRRYLDN